MVSLFTQYLAGGHIEVPSTDPRSAEHVGIPVAVSSPEEPATPVVLEAVVITPEMASDTIPSQTTSHGTPNADSQIEVETDSENLGD